MEWTKASLVDMDLSNMAQFFYYFLKKYLKNFFVLPWFAFKSKNPHNFWSKILVCEKITFS
jgi:hypothetical protein